MKVTCLICAGVLLVIAAVSSHSQDRLSFSRPLNPASSSSGSDGLPLSPSRIDGDDDPQYGLHLFPKRGGKLDWGLALSGGGLRAAAFSLGAMKSLYDQGILDDIDVISSVSGGGYASYWLFTNYDKNRAHKFGESAFSHDNFIKNVCVLQSINRSNLVRDKQYLRILLRGDKGFRDYQGAIENSFGTDPLSRKNLDFLNPEFEALDAPPYFIVNATLKISDADKKKNPRLRQASSAVFELAPHFRGNPVIGFRDWTTDANSIISFSESIAMSGAPKFYDLVGIRGAIQNFHTNTIKGKRLYLRDGGFSENLGALALIKRGIPNIIIIDAEVDPSYKFDAYVVLQKMLKKDLQIELCIPNIERFLKSGKSCNVSDLDVIPVHRRKFAASVSVGRAYRSADHGSPFASQIYYVKMSSPEAVLPEYFSDIAKDPKKQARIDEGERIYDLRQCERCPPADTELINCSQQCPESPECDCEKIKLKGRIDSQTYDTLYAEIVWSYSNYLNNPKQFRLWAKTKSFNAAGKSCYFLTKTKALHFVWPFCSVLSYDFPHTTTLDQSFFSDQLEAFVGLGYLQTKKLKRQGQ